MLQPLVARPGPRQLGRGELQVPLDQVEVGTSGEREGREGLVPQLLRQPHRLLGRGERAAVIAQGAPADADVVLCLGHAAGQPRLLVRGEGELVAGERLAPLAAQIRDDAKVIETSRLCRRVVQCPREIERRSEMRLGTIHLPGLQRDGALIVARPQLGVTFPPPAGNGEGGCRPAARLAMGP